MCSSFLSFCLSLSLSRFLCSFSLTFLRYVSEIKRSFGEYSFSQLYIVLFPLLTLFSPLSRSLFTAFLSLSFVPGLARSFFSLYPFYSICLLVPRLSRRLSGYPFLSPLEIFVEYGFPSLQGKRLKLKFKFNVTRSLI